MTHCAFSQRLQQGLEDVRDLSNNGRFTVDKYLERVSSEPGGESSLQPDRHTIAVHAAAGHSAGKNFRWVKYVVSPEPS
jgi:hypothetical protein